MIITPDDLGAIIPVVFFKPITTLTIPLKGREVIVECAPCRE